MQLQAQDAHAVNGNAHTSETNGGGAPATSWAVSADAPGEPVEDATPGSCYYWAAGAAFLCSVKVWA